MKIFGKLPTIIKQLTSKYRTISSYNNQPFIPQNFNVRNEKQRFWVTNNKKLLDLANNSFGDITSGNYDSLLLPERKELQVDIVRMADSTFSMSDIADQAPHASISIGGPSALITSFLETKRFLLTGQTDIKPPIFITRRASESNAYWSGLQIHQRHAQRMAFDDSRYDGLTMLKIALSRLLKKHNPEDIDHLDYLTTDFDWNEIFRNNPLIFAKICMESELITWIDKLNYLLNNRTTGMFTYYYAKESIRMLKILNSQLGNIYYEGAISVCLSEKEKILIQKRNAWLLEKFGLNAQEITRKELADRFALIPNFFNGGSFYYPNDGALVHDFWPKTQEAIQKLGGIVKTMDLKQIVIDNNMTKVVGVVVCDANDNNRLRFIKTNHVYASLGYSVTFNFPTANATSLFLPSQIESTTTAVGFSAFAVVLGRAPKVPISFNGHHTTSLMTTPNKKYGEVTLVRTTGGANIGSDSSYNTNHALNNLWYNFQIFQDRFQLISARGCSRSINASNSGKFTVFPGLVIGTGRGGKGVTDMCADAVTACKLIRPSETPIVDHKIDTSPIVSYRPNFFEQNATPFFRAITKDSDDITYSSYRMIKR